MRSKRHQYLLAAALLIAALSAFLCSCGANDSHNLTVPIENGFSIEGKTIIDGNMWSSADYIKVYPDAQALYPDASAIVLGTVKSITYSDEGGIATTYYNFEITECWEGDLKAKDKITVAHNGGYLRGKVFNAQQGYKLYDDDAVIKECVYNIPLPCEGDKYLLFLTEWEEGTFCALNTFMARYYVDEAGELSRFVPDDEYCRWIIAQGSDPNTVDEMREQISGLQKEYAGKPAVTMAENIEMVKAWYPQLYYGGENVAEKYEEACQKILQSARNTIADIREKPTVLIISSLDTCLAAGGDTFQNSLIEAAGGINAAEGYRNKGNFSKLTKEEILILNPDYLVMPENAGFELMRSELSALPAVKDGRIIVIPEECAHQIYPAEVKLGRGDPESFIGMAYLLYQLHSDVYSWQSFIEDAEEYAAIIGEFWDSYEDLLELEVYPYEAG